MKTLCPLDFSSLSALSIDRNTTVPWRVFAPIVQNIETLDVVAEARIALRLDLITLTRRKKFADTLDLSAFPRLTLLRISALTPTPTAILRILLTIAPSNRIRRIILCVRGIRELFGQQLDPKLSNLVVHHPLVVELDPEKQYARKMQVPLALHFRLLPLRSDGHGLPPLSPALA
ncbi:hypothetical protein B0H13DRAFT_2315935 [Mycena leptocephala]|nr:hypothetical protein B0H13DRAFT_2315935 [Mycena leptocephala]